MAVVKSQVTVPEVAAGGKVVRIEVGGGRGVMMLETVARAKGLLKEADSLPSEQRGSNRQPTADSTEEKARKPARNKARKPAENK